MLEVRQLSSSMPLAHVFMVHKDARYEVDARPTAPSASVGPQAHPQPHLPVDQLEPWLTHNPSSY